MTTAKKTTDTLRHGLDEGAGVFKALGHPERLRVVRLLARGPLCVCDLHEACPSDMSTLSKHLAVLLRAGVVSRERRGRELHYSLKLTCAADFLECLLRERPGCACAVTPTANTSKKPCR